MNQKQIRMKNLTIVFENRITVKGRKKLVFDYSEKISIPENYIKVLDKEIKEYNKNPLKRAYYFEFEYKNKLTN